MSDTELIVSFPNLSLSFPQQHYCYKNGQDIATLGLNFDPNTTSIVVPIDGPLQSVIGVYQCFVETVGGTVSTATTRVLEDGECYQESLLYGLIMMLYSLHTFTLSGSINPPSNLKCELVPGFSPYSTVTITWDPPSLNTWPVSILMYNIHYVELHEYVDISSLDRRIIITGLEQPSYCFAVTVYTGPNQQRSADVWCSILTEQRGKQCPDTCR